MLSTPELLIVLFIVLLIFGAQRLPELGRGLGQGMRSFRDAVKGEDKSHNPEPKSENAPNNQS